MMDFGSGFPSAVCMERLKPRSPPSTGQSKRSTCGEPMCISAMSGGMFGKIVWAGGDGHFAAGGIHADCNLRLDHVRSAVQQRTSRVSWQAVETRACGPLKGHVERLVNVLAIECGLTEVFLDFDLDHRELCELLSRQLDASLVDEIAAPTFRPSCSEFRAMHNRTAETRIAACRRTRRARVHLRSSPATSDSEAASSTLWSI